MSPSTVATGSFRSRPAEPPSAAAGVALAAGAAGTSAAGVDAAGVSAAGVAAAGVEGAGVEAGVAAAGVATGVAAGVVGAGVAAGVAVGAGVPLGSGAAAGWDGLHEERKATAAAKVSTMEDALFISKEAFLRTRRNSTPVEICIFQFTA